MTTEELLRDRLRSIADETPERDLTDAVVRRGRRRQARRRALAAGATATAVVGVVVAVVVLPGRSGPAGHRAVDHPTPPPTATTTAISDAQFTVPGPQLGAVSGPAPVHHRPCRPQDITAVAETRPAAGGVVGVIQLTGHGCSLAMYAGPSALLDSRGHRLSVPVTPSAIAVSNPRPDLAVGFGQAAWGFAWNGSWCGPAAATVVFPLREDPAYLVAQHSKGTLRVPLSGPSPRCDPRLHTMVGSSSLVRGAIGSFDQGVLPAPRSWTGLTATLHVDSPSNGTRLTGIAVTLHNDTAVDVALDPCPRWSSLVTAADKVGTEIDGSGDLLDCGNTGRVVPAHGTSTFSMPDQTYATGVPHPGARPGSRVHVAWDIAGVPIARAVVRVRS